MAGGPDRLKAHLIGQSLAPADGLAQAKVTAVGPPVTVSWQGGSYQFPHLASYTPVVNDLVAMVRYGGSWLIIGEPVGFP